MDRLYEKKIVDRKIESGRGGLHYLYYPSKTKQEFEKTVVDQTVNKLIEAFGPTAVSYFDERFKKGATNRSKSKRKD
jgi:predicted transcriptional regulator